MANGVQIFAVGIGTNLDKEQLNKITRDPERVYYAETIDKLISDDFVQQVSQKTCNTTSSIQLEPKPGQLGKFENKKLMVNIN